MSLEAQLRESVRRARGSAAMLLFEARARCMAEDNEHGVIYTSFGRHTEDHVSQWWVCRPADTYFHGRKIGKLERYAGNYGVHGCAGTWLS